MLCFNHSIRPPALFRHRHLACQNGRPFVFCHACSCKTAAALRLVIRIAQNDKITGGIPASFKQQRHIQNNHGSVLLPLVFQKPVAVCGDQRMNNRLQCAPLVRITKHNPAKLLPVNRSVFSHHIAAKHRGDRGDGCAAGHHQLMHGSIGIMHRNAGSADHLGGCRLAGGNAACQTDNHHLVTRMCLVRHVADPVSDKAIVSPCPRRNARSGSIGRPRISECPPSIRLKR